VELHRFIIEWHEARNWANDDNTFQVILHDPAHYPTSTGDGDIVFQYLEFHDSGAGAPGWDNPYCTVGIENGNATDGLTLSYWSNLAPTMHEIDTGTAILITTNPSGLVGDPHLVLSPTELALYLPPDCTAVTSLLLQNTGNAALSFLFSIENLDNRDYGGDEFGYTWIDSDEGAGPVYNWVDITGAGQEIIFADHDASTSALELGFEMSLYGERFDQLWINANGFVSLSDSCSGIYCWYNQPLPDPDMPLNLIAGYWDDLRPEENEPGFCYFYTNQSDSAVVSFINVPHANPALQQGPFTFQIILRANGEITYQYDSMGNCTFGTVGIQNYDGLQGINLVYNDYYIHDEMGIRFTAPFWMTIEPVSGIVPAWAEREIAVHVDPAGASLQEGDYHGLIRLETNDAENPLVEIPVFLNVDWDDVVAGGQPAGFYLRQNYPNPFNPATLIEYGLEQAGEVRLAVYNLRGQLLQVLTEGEVAAGRHELILDASAWSAGVYFYRLEAGEYVETRKMLLVK